MKTALSVITLALCTALPGAAEDVSPAPLKPEKLSIKTAIKPCRSCSHAPCRCGYSPSYYTHYCRPRSSYPISSRLFQGVNSRVKPPAPTSSTLVPTPRPPRVPPAVTPKTALNFDSRLAFEPPRRFDRDLCFRPIGALFGRGVASRHGGGHHRPDFDDDGFPTEKFLLRQLKKSQTVDTGTLVPTPRPPKAVPDATPDVTLGFDPSQSWLRFLTPSRRSIVGSRLAFDPPRSFDRDLCFRPTGALFGRSVVSRPGGGGHRPGFDDDFSPTERFLLRQLKRSQTIDTGTLVPTPRRARTVPAVTPKQSLGFDPNRSWSRSLSRRGGRGHSGGGRVPRAR